MPEYKYINRYYLMWTLFFSLLCSICLIITGSVPWQTSILEEALVDTKRWQLNIGIFICLLVVVGTVSFEAGSKGLSWLYVFCTLSLALVAFVHAIIDMDEENDALVRTQLLLDKYFDNYEDPKKIAHVNNFQKRMRCCGLKDKNEMMRGELCHFVKSCCYWRVKNCTDKVVYKEPCYGKAKHVIHLLRMCAALGIISGSVQLSVLVVLGVGALKYIYHLIFPPGGPIITE
ncbi:unnamed protein product [Psylliodes chrysocephalus]|uniref:Tetraspanin n=1 Tax=Psylliodes chrysocephalus TaxID=3402493 RepID=A0A9P0GD30_9CUCU|nr:unnamed protein product [Psylliodes chrysocephala]